MTSYLTRLFRIAPEASGLPQEDPAPLIEEIFEAVFSDGYDWNQHGTRHLVDLARKIRRTVDWRGEFSTEDLRYQARHVVMDLADFVSEFRAGDSRKVHTNCSSIPQGIPEPHEDPWRRAA